MAIDLRNRDTTGELIAFVKFKDEAFYCMAEVEYWIVEWWNGYVELNKCTLEEQYFNYIKRFKLNYIELADEYMKLLPKMDLFDIEGNKPTLYIDFNLKYFRSYFQEQELERRMPIGWKGEYGEIIDLIPQNFKYWS